MRFFALLGLLAAPLLLPGCASVSDSVGDFTSNASGGFTRGDTYGTQRRPDVYGAITAPSLPTIGQPGFGK